jgi:fucose 4-O-acetylase-like acetyltransferase
MTTRNKARLSEVDLLKGWSILGVIFIHMSFASRFSGDVIAAITKLQTLFGWAVVAFFFCAGFLYAKSSHAMQPVATYAAKRARRLLLPWLGFSLLYKALLIAGYHFHLVAAAPPHQLWPLLLWPGAPQLYFLPMLFLVSVFFRFLFTVLRQEWPLWLLALLLAAAYAWLGAGAPHGGEIKNLPAYAATYLAGVLTANPPLLARINRRRLFLALIILGFTALCVAQPTLAYLAVPLAAFPLQRLLVGPMASPIDFLGKYSGPIYVWHTPIVMPFLSILLAKTIHAGPWLLIPALATLTVALSVAIGLAGAKVDRIGILTI